jgi:predicted enzyme related to lactoylglutathione lyase
MERPRPTAPINPRPHAGLKRRRMMSGPSKPVVHLELHTGDLERARRLYAEVCGWRPEPIDTRDGSYLALELGRGLGGGIVECDTERPLWLPYVEVLEVTKATERARLLGASVLLEPREGPAGWRSVVATRAGGEIAFWQPKRWGCTPQGRQAS